MPYSVPELSNTSDSETDDSQNAEQPNANTEAIEVHNPRYIYIKIKLGIRIMLHIL